MLSSESGFCQHITKILTFTFLSVLPVNWAEVKDGNYLLWNMTAPLWSYLLESLAAIVSNLVTGIGRSNNSERLALFLR